MDEDIRIGRAYKEAFNLGYELAKELNLKSPMFNNPDSGNNRMIAMQAGMEQCGVDLELKQEKNRSKGFEMGN